MKIAFTHAFRHLIAGSDFTLALRETLAGGGDTDTNACIVAGLIGAASGAEAIPGKQATAVLACDTTAGRHSRPAFLTTGDLRTLVENLLTP